MAGALLEDCQARPADRTSQGAHFARADALVARDDILLARARIEGATAEGERIRLGLTSALQSVGIETEAGEVLGALVVAADRFLDRSLVTEEKELAARRLAAEIAERRESAWQAEVKKRLRGTWLEDGIAGTRLGRVLDQLSELAKTLQDGEDNAVRSTRSL